MLPHSRIPRGMRRLAWPLLLLAVAGCGEPSKREVPKAEPGVVPASVQREGDPAAGYDELVNGGYVTCGIPYAAWRRSGGDDGAAGSLPGRDERNTGLPYYLTRYVNEQGVDLVVTNCLLCHGGRIDDEVIVGLGNESLDFTTDPREGVVAVGNYVSGARETRAWRKWGERIAAIAPYMITDTVGVNPAPNLTLALIAHRDPQTLAWSDEPLLEPPAETPLPVSVPPWWRMAKKHSMFYNGMGRGDHVRYMMMKSLVCADSLEEARSIEERFTDVRAYIASLEPPEYPWPIDRALAAEGEPVFDRHCAGCHGTYGAEESYPNLLVDLETVGTDPAYARQAYQDSDRFMRWFNDSWYGATASARPAPAYIAPPLDGVWATAPFLHNGSVPTLATLLNSSRRPTYWTRSFRSTDFDPAEVGWHYEELAAGKSAASESVAPKRIYDTTRYGYGNQGHIFGDALTDTERRAIIEYLKTL